MQRCSFRGCWDDGSDSIRLLNPNTGSPDHAIYACFKHANEARRAGIVWHDGPGHPNLIDNHRVARRQLVEEAFTTKPKGQNKMAIGNWKINHNPKRGHCRIFGCRSTVEARGLCTEHFDAAEAAGELDKWALPEAKLSDRPTGAEAVAVAAVRLGMDEGAELRARIAALEQEVADRDEALAGQKERAENAIKSLKKTEEALQIQEARARKLETENQGLTAESIELQALLNKEKEAYKLTVSELDRFTGEFPGETILERIRNAAQIARLPRPKALTRDDLERRCAQLHECDRVREGLAQGLPLVFAGLELPADLAREILGTHADRLEQFALALD